MTKERFKPIDYCYSLPPQEYYGLLETISQNREFILRNAFVGIERTFGNEIALILTGSDGKRERHPQSKIGIIVLANTLVSPQELLKQIQEGVQAIGDHSEEIEIKYLQTGNLSFYQQDLRRAYPDRILGSQFLVGNPDLFYQARLKVLQEMTDDDETGKRIREQMKKQLNSYRKSLLTGSYRNQTIFDDSRQYYFEGHDWSLNRFGFKMGPLRAVQRKFDLLLSRLIKQRTTTPEQLAVTFPSNTAAKFKFLAEKGILPEGTAEAYSLAYPWFLREYHKVQEAFKNSPQKSVVSTTFNPEEFNQNRQLILSFLDFQPKTP